MIADATITVWTPVQADLDHRSWMRSVVGGCRIEESRGSSATNPQAAVSDSASLYVFRDVALSEGCMVCAGVSDADEPPSSALRVTSSERWTLHGRFHHLEAHLR